MCVEKVLDFLLQLVKNGSKNKSVCSFVQCNTELLLVVVAPADLQVAAAALGTVSPPLRLPAKKKRLVRQRVEEKQQRDSSCLQQHNGAKMVKYRLQARVVDWIYAMCCFR